MENMEISAHLQDVGVTHGSSEANIRKFCLESGINRRSGSLSESELDFAVETSKIMQIGTIALLDKFFGVLDCSQCRAQ